MVRLLLLVSYSLQPGICVVICDYNKVAMWLQKLNIMKHRINIFCAGRGCQGMQVAIW
jgi:hypothetical protein